MSEGKEDGKDYDDDQDQVQAPLVFDWMPEGHVALADGQF